MTLTNMLVPTFSQMLATLSGWLAKAEAQISGGEAEALLSARLAPDMFPLSTQIRFACVQPQEAVSRLTGQAYPATVGAMLEEGRHAAERPGSIAQAQARIAETLALLGSLAPDALDVDPASTIIHALPNGMTFDLTAERYARDWCLAQFYFHVMIAYAILRSHNVAIGKADYIPHLLPYLRVEAAPKG